MTRFQFNIDDHLPVGCANIDSKVVDLLRRAKLRFSASATARQFIFEAAVKNV
jgi:hypothetical protein